MRWKIMRFRWAMPMPGVRGAFHSWWWCKRVALWQNGRRAGPTRFLRLFVSFMEARAQRCTPDGQWSGFDGSWLFSQLWKLHVPVGTSRSPYHAHCLWSSYYVEAIFCASSESFDSAFSRSAENIKFLIEWCMSVLSTLRLRRDHEK